MHHQILQEPRKERVDREKDQGTGFPIWKTSLPRSASRHTTREGAAEQRNGGKNSASSRNDQQLGKMAGVRYENESQRRDYDENTQNRNMYLGPVGSPSLARSQQSMSHIPVV